MAKISSKFFQVLRQKVHQKFPAPVVPDRWSREVREERDAWKRAEAMKVMKSMTAAEIRKVAMDAVQGIDFDYKRVVNDEKFVPAAKTDIHKAKRESLLKKIEKAELLSMAGDDKAALALIAEISD